MEKVISANKIADIFEGLVPFSKYSKHGLDLVLEYYSAESLPKALLPWMMGLLQDNMREMYENCKEWGWKPRQKRKELLDGSARFIVAFAGESRDPVAFVHLRYMFEENVLELYLWEIQLAESVRGKGLGRFLMRVVEMCAFRHSFPQVTLTVFKDNKSAQHFFREICGYSTDVSDPSFQDLMGEYGYDILSKSIPCKRQ